MVLFVSLLFLLVAFSGLDWVQCDPKRFATADKNIFHFAALHSSTIQPYFADNRTISSTELNAKQALKIWMIVRHGSRTGKKRENDKFKSMEALRAQIIKNLKNVDNCPLSEDNWKRLKKWEWNEAFEHDRVLTDTGKKELRLIAKNYKTRFPTLFAPPFDKDNFNVISTNSSRTIDSAVEFFNAAIGKKGCSDVLVVATKREEKIIKAYKDKNFHEKNKRIENSGNSLADQFCKTKTFVNMVEEVNKRLLFNDTENQDRVENMYDLCRYEGTWTLGAKSVWCSMFTESELKVLEYKKDLNSFSENGPSHELNKGVHCPSVIDMMNHLSRSGGPTVTAYFTHSPALLLHLTAMGLYAKDKLTPEYTKYSEGREWNTSKLSPMAANFAAVLYQNNKVKFFLNDKVVHLPLCGNGLCDLKALNFVQCK